MKFLHEGACLKTEVYIFSGQTLTENPQRLTSCQDTSLLASCSAGSIIAVTGIQYGTKLEATCSLSNTTAGCCDYDAADCLIDYAGTSQQASCSGRTVCLDVSVAAADTSSCGVDYPILNHYLSMEYQCIPG